MPLVDVEGEEYGRTLAALMRAIKAIEQTAASGLTGALDLRVALEHVQQYARTAHADYRNRKKRSEVDSL